MYVTSFRHLVLTSYRAPIQQVVPKIISVASATEAFVTFRAVSLFMAMRGEEVGGVGGAGRVEGNSRY